VTLVSLISDLRLGDLNYLLSVKPTLQHKNYVGLLLITKQTFAKYADGRLKMTFKRLSRGMNSERLHKQTPFS
jgi:hypothetical protein